MLKIKNIYPGQVDETVADLPHGAAQNDLVEDDGIGTPLEKTWVNELEGFKQALVAEAGVTPNDTPERVGASQLVAAIKLIGEAQLASLLGIVATAGDIDWTIAVGKTLTLGGLGFLDLTGIGVRFDKETQGPLTGFARTGRVPWKPTGSTVTSTTSLNARIFDRITAHPTVADIVITIQADALYETGEHMTIVNRGWTGAAGKNVTVNDPLGNPLLLIPSRTSSGGQYNWAEFMLMPSGLWEIYRWDFN